MFVTGTGYHLIIISSKLHVPRHPRSFVPNSLASDAVHNCRSAQCPTWSATTSKFRLGQWLVGKTTGKVEISRQYHVRSSVWNIQINFNLKYTRKFTTWIGILQHGSLSMLLGLPFLPESSAPIVKKTSLSLKTSQARLFTMKLLEPSHTCSAAARWALLPQDALCQRLDENWCNMMTS